MRGNWTSVGSMYLGMEMPLFFLLLSNPHSSNNIRRRQDDIPPFLVLRLAGRISPFTQACGSDEYMSHHSHTTEAVQQFPATAIRVN